MAKSHPGRSWATLVIFVAASLVFATYATVSNSAPTSAGAFAPPDTARGVKFQSTPARLQRGQYLAEHAADCFGCHSDVDWKNTGLPKPGRKGAGGLIPDDALPFKIYAPNITPDPETGSGNWTDEQFVRALRQGIGNDGRTLFPMMPYHFFRSLSDEDLASIVVYIRSLPPVKHKVPRNEIPKEFQALLQPLPPVDGPVPAPDASDPVKRGEYLVGSVAACAACHTPLNQDFTPNMDLAYAGGSPLIGPWGNVHSANITPDPSGISYYDEDFFLKTIRTGKVGGVRELKLIMPWVRYKGMTDEDLKSIFAFLQALPPVQHRVDNTEPPAPCKRCGAVHGFGDLN